MANEEVVVMWEKNLASLIELAKKLLVEWGIKFNDLLHFFQNIRKDDMLGLIAGTHEIKAKILLPIHPDYKLIKKGIVIVAKERDRQEILNDSSNYVLGDNFKKLLAECTNGKTDPEILREDELLKGKTDEEIKKEMKISEISIEQIAERIIYFRKITRWTIIGCYKGLVVHADPFGDGRVRVYAYGLDACFDGYRLLSRDIVAV
ncbi:MAG: hypothetical protein WCG45_00980 [bacterium]